MHDSDEFKLYDYNDDIVLQYRRRNKPTTLESKLQQFSPKRLGARLMIEFATVCNKDVDVKEYGKKYGLKYDKIICFKYADLPLAPFFFTVVGGKLLLLKNEQCNNQYHTMIVSDLNTVLNILYENVTLQKARRDGKVMLHGDKIGHDEAIFFEIFNTVAPQLKNKINIWK